MTTNEKPLRKKGRPLLSSSKASSTRNAIDGASNRDGSSPSHEEKQQTKTRRVSDPNRVLQGLVLKSQGVSTRFVDAFRSKLEEKLEEELESKKRLHQVATTKSFVQDKVGNEMAKLFNENPDFHYSSWSRLQEQQQSASMHSDNYLIDEDGSVSSASRSFRPLLSKRNLNRLNRLVHRIVLPQDGVTWIVHWKGNCYMIQNAVRFVFYNKRFSFKGLYQMFLGFLIIWLTFMTTEISIVGFHIFQFGGVVVYFVLGVLIDIEEFKRQTGPKQVRYFWTKLLLPVIKAVDNVVLFRNRFSGREWNKHDFDFSDGKLALSSSQALLYPKENLKKKTKTSSTSTSTSVSPLWTVPPPSIKAGKRLCLDGNYIKRSSWGLDTTKHIVAIDFCYVMLYGEISRKQGSRRKLPFFGYRKASSDPTRASRKFDTRSMTNAITISRGDRISYTQSYETRVTTKENQRTRKENSKRRAQLPANENKKAKRRSKRTDDKEKKPWSVQRDGISSIVSIDTSVSEENLDQSNNSMTTATSNPTSCSNRTARDSAGSPAEAIEVIRERHPSHLSADESLLSETADTDGTDTGNGSTLEEDMMGYGSSGGIHTEYDNFSDASFQPHTPRSVSTAELSPKKRYRHLALQNSTDTLESVESDRADLNWMDVGAEIGLKILSSEHVQRAMASQDTAARIITIKETMEEKLGAARQRGNTSNSKDTNLLDRMTPSSSRPGGIFSVQNVLGKEGSTGEAIIDSMQKTPGGLSVPVHSMWTSASAVARNSFDSSSTADDEQEGYDDDSVASCSSGHDTISPPDEPSSSPIVLENSSTTFKKISPSRSPLRQAKFSLGDLVKRSPLRRKRRRGSKSSSKKKSSQKHNDLLRGFQRERVYESDETASTDTNDNDEFNDNALHLSISVSHDSILSSEKRKGGKSPMNAESIEIVCGGAETGTGKSNQLRHHQLMPGVKIVVPMFPIQPGCKPSTRILDSRYQMATVVSSKRIFVPTSAHSNHSKKRTKHHSSRQFSNCLSITVKLDKSFLRNGEFAEMTFRVMDEWGPKYIPKHSKLPLGSCVATSFGLGILVGWRVEDDMHVVRSLWQHRGAGSACAYLRRDSIHSTIEAAVGFDVQTRLGKAKILSYVDGGREFRSGRYFVRIKEAGRKKGHVLELKRSDILSCYSAAFIPVIEHIREAAQYQLQVDHYTATMKQQECIDLVNKPVESWRCISKYFDILWSSFLLAIEEDKDFDDGMNHFITSIINFLERLDRPESGGDSSIEDSIIQPTASKDTITSKPIPVEEKQDPGFWIMNDMFGGIFNGSGKKSDNDSKRSELGDEIMEVTTLEEKKMEEPEDKGPTSYDRAFSMIRTLMRTVSIAKAKSVDEPNFKLGLSICYEFLIFVKTVLKVQQKNVSPHSLEVWGRAWEEIVSTFGPVKERLEKIGQGIADRMEKQGRRAKIRLLRFVDTIVQDDSLLLAAEEGDWDRCAQQLELAMVKAKIIDEENREHYHKTAQFVYEHFSAVNTKSGSAGARNYEKMLQVAAAAQWIASPQKSILKLFLNDQVLGILERILVRVFYAQEKASRMISIHASNFHSLRHLRMLKDWTIAGKLWMPLVDAADAEFSWMVSRMPETTKDLMGPLSSLFSLGVVQFHKIDEGDLTKDWLDFLLEDEAVSLIHDIDMKLILALESFSRDIKEMMVVLPYYPSIEDDILNLMDEVDLDEFLKEAADAIDDAEKLSEFIREKATIAIERFLDYLPKMSIPVEKRDLGDGWVLTCRGEDGGDLTLSDVNIKRENLTCQVMGGDTLFFPMLGTDDDVDVPSVSMSYPLTPAADKSTSVETSILDHIRELLLQAQRHGCWQAGVGGVGQPASDRYVSSVLHDLPISSVLNCGIELWRNLEIDDDELLEIAIRDVSYQIQLQKEREEGSGQFGNGNLGNNIDPSSSHSGPFENPRGRFNPRVDPTVIFLEMKKLTLHLEQFLFRIEKHESHRTIFDPVFEGCGSLTVKNVSITLRVECAKDRVSKLGSQQAIPALQLRELDVGLEKVILKVRDTGADWLLNKVVQGFSDNITQVMASNLEEQVREQIELALDNVNGYFEVNPDLMLSLLGITLEDLEERVVWV